LGCPKDEKNSTVYRTQGSSWYNIQNVILLGALAWNHNTLTSGSRDRIIYHRDVRDSSEYSAKLVGHRQEVCGIKWNPEGAQMASGGNDNKLFIWDVRNSQPTAKFSDHVAAVKAIAWSPHTVRRII
jgi:cell division cycle 20-like protein 1 (cofactor of APC complex)